MSTVIHMTRHAGPYRKGKNKQYGHHETGGVTWTPGGSLKQQKLGVEAREQGKPNWPSGATTCKGVWGHAPPGNFWDFRCSEVLSGVF